MRTSPQRVGNGKVSKGPSEDLTAKGAQISEPSTIAGICRQAFPADPTGNLIELNQPIAAD